MPQWKECGARGPHLNVWLTDSPQPAISGRGVDFEQACSWLMTVVAPETRLRPTRTGHCRLAPTWRLGDKWRPNWLHLIGAGSKAFSIGDVTPALSSSLYTVNDRNKFWRFVMFQKHEFVKRHPEVSETEQRSSESPWVVWSDRFCFQGQTFAHLSSDHSSINELLTIHDLMLVKQAKKLDKLSSFFSGKEQYSWMSFIQK